MIVVLGYSFGNAELSGLALRHPSVGGRRENGAGAPFERLEFLGDRVLGLVIATALYSRFPHEAEGALSRRLAALVRATTLAALAREAGLTAQLTLAANEGANGGTANDNIMADAMEAVIGAIYLDGGLEAARSVILRLWGERIGAEPAADRDPKTQLQEWAQARGPRLPQYDVLSQSGPAHAPCFEVKVSLPDGRAAVAQGSSKRQAEQMAAALLLGQLENKHD